MHFAVRCMDDPEIGLRMGLGLIDEAGQEKWEKTRKELKARACELLAEHHRKKFRNREEEEKNN
jgi:hypothetical protein